MSDSVWDTKEKVAECEKLTTFLLWQFNLLCSVWIIIIIDVNLDELEHFENSAK